jgi:hypothetical protein
MNDLKDARARPGNRSKIGLENQSFVFGLFEQGQKLTVRDVYELAREKKKQNDERPLNERTIRRAIESLEETGFLITVGRHGGAVLFAKQGTSAFDNPKNELIPLSGELVSVEKFLRTFADPSIDALKLKLDTLSVESDRNIRQMLLFAVISAGEVGLDRRLKSAAKGLYAYLDEINHIQKTLQTFIESHVWYEQYRDRIAYEVRRVQEKDPELYQLTLDAIKGG